MCPVATTASTSPLADVLAGGATGHAGGYSAEAVRDALVTSIVYCERPEVPGFRALGRPGDGVIAVFTSVEALALARGTVEWFALPGAELLDRLPPGYDLLVDIASSAVRLRPAALGRRVAIELTADPAGPRAGAAR